MPKINYINPTKLKTHERINSKRAAALKRELLRRGKLINPLIADQRSLVILDGHHRFFVLKQLKAKSIPVHLVDYSSSRVQVVSRRSTIEITKSKVVRAGVLGKLFPYKSSRHYIPNRPTNINIPLSKIL